MKKSLLFPKLTLLAALSAVAIAFNGSADETAGAYTGKPYGGKPQDVPGIIEAEHYDVAPGNANGITWNRHGQPKPGNARTTGDCIGIATIGSDHVGTKGEKPKVGEFYVGWTDAGDWWKYTVNVKEAGTYAFGAHVSAGAKGAKISVTFTPLAGGAAVTTGPLEIPTTAGFQPGVEVYHVWETLDGLADVKLDAGAYVMTVKIEGKIAGINIDNYSLTKK